MTSQQETPFCEVKDNGDAIIHSNLRRGPWAERVPEHTLWDRFLTWVPVFVLCGGVACFGLLFLSIFIWG